jgi:hypothetical protein
VSGSVRDFLRQVSANAIGSLAALVVAGLISGFIRPHWAEVCLTLSAFPIVILAFRGARWLWHKTTGHLYPIERNDLVGLCQVCV